MNDEEIKIGSAYLLGRTHGLLGLLLNEPTENLRPKLQNIFDNLTHDVTRMYYHLDIPYTTE